MDARLGAVKQDIERLKAEIEEAKARLQNGGLSAIPLARRALGAAPKRRRVLQGHFGKVYALDWSLDSEHFVSASQDGKLLVWNARTKHKEQVIPLKSTWVMTCAFEPTENRVIACGGLDNIASLYTAGPGAPSKPVLELQGHDGYLSCCRFVDDRGLLTASGDSTCIYWDTSRGDDVCRFMDHTNDVMSLDVHPTNRNLFVSGSVDSSAKVWDLRTGRCAQTFVGHDNDINAVRFMRNGLSFGTGSDDSSLKIFDLRSYARVNEMLSDGIVCGIASVDFSASGRVMFAGYDDCNVYGWDTLAENAPAPAWTLMGHRNRVICIGVNPAGQALCTGSWDMELALWA